ncbi:DNA internalization-related competence protein ComEC/Rec2 [Cytobacillus sp. FJAT-53684]|uniref:DNA internalization-related competence protein ComEC/Rec2 n=1 Tax=Cytobacillus mangrovibacter TaxID=3299024 RepID=A0ABW6K094_9BACI
MQGRWIYFTVAALLGILAIFVHLFFFSALFILLFTFLYKMKAFPSKQLFILCLIFILFLARSEIAEKANKTKFLAEETNFYVQIQEDVKIDGELFSAKGKELNRKEKLVLSYKIKTVQEKEWLSRHLKTGMACKVTGSLIEPNPSTNENAFNYKDYLNRNQMYWLLKVEQLDLSQCSPQTNSLFTFFRILRVKGITYVQENFPIETAPLAAALLFGERDFIDPDVLRSYEKLGIVHLLAISGLHVGMLAGMIYFLGIRAGIRRERMTTALLLFLPCYALLTGAAPSVIRAVFMMILFLALRKWGLFSLNTIDIISIVFIIYTFFTPYVIYDVGFQLSFGVSFSLILSAPILLPRFSNPISLLSATSFICQLAATPIMFYYFYEVSLISILANAIFIPIFSLIVLPALFFLFLLHLLFGTIINLLIHPLNLIIMWMDYGALKLSLLPFSMLTLGRPPMLIMFMYLLSTPLFFSLWEHIKGIKRFVQILCVPFSIMLIHAISHMFSPYGELTIIDVGQGDSIFIKLPYGKGNYLIDTGGNIRFNTEEWRERKEPFEVGKDVIVPFLKSKGVTRIDKLVLTHGDADHIGGAAEVINEIKVKEIILPKSQELSELEKKVLVTAKKKGIPWQFVSAGDSWESQNIIFHVLSPQEGVQLERNDQSIVLFAAIGGLKWLFTGDLEEKGEEQLVEHYNNLKIDVLKAGHHGSKTSTTPLFLDQVQPKLAVISAGKNNRYGHPHQEVLENLKERRIRILRTDIHGAITYIFSGDHGTFSAQHP